MPVDIHQLKSDDAAMMKSLSDMFGVAFGDVPTYSHNQPNDDYLVQLLGSDSFIALAALRGTKVVGGLAAYELRKYEQLRSEIYIYDLAVAKEERRNGIATNLIERLKWIGLDRGAYEIFVQADTDVEDGPAISLYSQLGVREEVLHFSIPINSEVGVA